MSFVSTTAPENTQGLLCSVHSWVRNLTELLYGSVLTAGLKAVAPKLVYQVQFWKWFCFLIWESYVLSDVQLSLVLKECLNNQVLQCLSSSQECIGSPLWALPSVLCYRSYLVSVYGQRTWRPKSYIIYREIQSIISCSMNGLLIENFFSCDTWLCN